MGEFSLSHIVVLLVIMLIFFGPSRLPGLGKSLGEAIRGFKKGMDDIGSDKPADPNQRISSSQTHSQPTAHEEEKDKNKV